MTKEEMAKLVEQSAELGARKALRDIGLSDDDALSDVSPSFGAYSTLGVRQSVPWGKPSFRRLTTLFLSGTYGWVLTLIFLDKSMIYGWRNCSTYKGIGYRF